MEPIVLASASPRRQEILKKLDIPFIVHPANIEEAIPEDIKLEDAPEYLAARKISAVAKSFADTQDTQWILGADTLIVYKNKIFGKPKSQEEARKFLKQLQGHTHKVITGLALYNGNIFDITTRTSINKVTFAPMSEEDINWYLATDEWHGVAGAYRIQGEGSRFISKIEGTESSVMGLPIYELCDMLREQNYPLFQ